MEKKVLICDSESRSRRGQKIALWVSRDDWGSEQFFYLCSKYRSLWQEELR